MCDVEILYSGSLLTLIQLKLAFDPLCILNCDKVIRVVPE
jgi:hypothetical protein